MIEELKLLYCKEKGNKFLKNLVPPLISLITENAESFELRTSKQVVCTTPVDYMGTISSFFQTNIFFQFTPTSTSC